MPYTTIKISDKATMIRSDCPKCGTTNRVTLQENLHDVGEIDIACIACRKAYSTTVFSTRWCSADSAA